MLRKRLRRYFTPSPTALTLTWAALALAFIIIATIAVLTIGQAEVDILFGVWFFGLPPAALLLTIAAKKEKKAGTRALYWLVIALIMLALTILFWTSIGENPTQNPLEFSVCCAPFNIVPIVLGLLFATKALPELRALIRLDRDQRAIEILLARGEATYAEIAAELDMPVNDVSSLLNDLQQSQRLDVVLNPIHERAETLTNLLEKHRRLQATIQARSKIHLSELESELRAPLDLIKEWLYELVQRGRLSGYVDWEKGIVYSLDRDHLQDLTHCPHCGGEMNLVGKGIIQCEYCAVEIFIPTAEVASRTQPQPATAAQTESMAFSFDAPTPPPEVAVETRFQRLRSLFKLAKAPKLIVILAASLLFIIGLCVGITLLMVAGGTGILIAVFALPLIALILIAAAVLEKRNPPRALLWSIVSLVLSVSGLLFVIAISSDASQNNTFDIPTSLSALLMLVAPVVLIVSLPALYFGVKSIPEINAALQLQLKERALKLINEKGEISFTEIAEKLQLPFNEVDNLVDQLLHSGELQGTFFADYQRVYTSAQLAEKRQQIIEIIKAQGQAYLAEISRQLHAPYDLLRDWIYQLVQLKQFNGYINWDEKKIFSLAANEIGSNSQCPNCGGTLGLSGEVILCQHCGSEIFRS